MPADSLATYAHNQSTQQGPHTLAVGPSAPPEQKQQCMAGCNIAEGTHIVRRASCAGVADGVICEARGTRRVGDPYALRAGYATGTIRGVAAGQRCQLRGRRATGEAVTCRGAAAGWPSSSPKALAQVLDSCLHYSTLRPNEMPDRCPEMLGCVGISCRAASRAGETHLYICVGFFWVVAAIFRRQCVLAVPVGG